MSTVKMSSSNELDVIKKNNASRFCIYVKISQCNSL